jgi:hypothetical protein
MVYSLTTNMVNVKQEGSPMTVSFCIEEEFIDLTEWFIRCVDGTIRDDYRQIFVDDINIRKTVKERVKEHNLSCPVCSATEQGAELEVESVIDSAFDTEINDDISEAIILSLGLPFRTGSKIYGYINGEDMKARLILALGFIEEDGKPVTDKVSNKMLLSYLNNLYSLSDYAAHLNRDVVWIEYPEF